MDLSAEEEMSHRLREWGTTSHSNNNDGELEAHFSPKWYSARHG